MKASDLEKAIELRDRLLAVLIFRGNTFDTPAGASPNQGWLGPVTVSYGSIQADLHLEKMEVREDLASAFAREESTLRFQLKALGVDLEEATP